MTRVEDLDIVRGSYANAVSILISLVQCFPDASPVVIEEPAVMHELKCSALNRGATLGSGRHESELVAIGLVFDRNGAVNRVVVLSDVQVGDEVPCRPVVTDSLLHLKTV